MIIYKITNPIGKVFIGKTTDLIKRIKTLGYTRKNNKSKLDKSLKEYGLKSHIIEILYEIDDIEECYNKHKETIAQYDSFKNGLNNFTASKRNLTCSENTRLKISLKNSGKVHSLESKIEAHKRAILKRKYLPSKAESDIIIKEYKTSEIKHNEIIKKYNLTSRQFKEILKSYNEKVIFKSNNGVKVINIKTNKIYRSIKEASKDTSMPLTNLQKRLQGKLKNTTDFRLLNRNKKINKKQIYNIRYYHYKNETTNVIKFLNNFYREDPQKFKSKIDLIIKNL